MHYPSSENKGADQLRGYREADLRLCFRLGKNPVLSWRGSHNICFHKSLRDVSETHDNVKEIDEQELLQSYQKSHTIPRWDKLN